MGATLQTKARGRRRFSRPPMAEINVTPMVDVMLVLLIIFMIAAPLLTVGVPVDLPKTQANNVPGQDEPLVVSIDKAGTIYLQETEVGIEQLAPRLQAITGANPEARIFVRGDQSIQYGLIMQVMGSLNTAGFRRVALIAELPKSGQGN